MDAAIITQLIESGGLVLIALIGTGTYFILTKRKKNIDAEIMLIQDALYYQLVLARMKEELKDEDVDFKYRDISREIEEVFGHKPSGNNYPSQLAHKLKRLNQHAETLENYISKHKFG